MNEKKHALRHNLLNKHFNEGQILIAYQIFDDEIKIDEIEDNLKKINGIVSSKDASMIIYTMLLKGNVIFLVPLF